ncbi:MAG TPA: tetratricopeptide repeat protein [Chloroflexota bacterium]
MPTLRVQTLGTFAVWRDGLLITAGAWRRRKAAALFKALLSCPEYRTHREQVAELLWPDSEPELADSNLRFTLHQLRGILDPSGVKESFVVTQDSHLILVPVLGQDPLGTLAYPTDWLDAARFTAAATHALTAEHAHDCKLALALYTGPYLPDDRYEEWVLPRAEELARLQLAVLLHRARILSKTGPSEDRIAAWQAVLTADHGHEEAAYTLMRALAEGGKTADALRVYAIFAAALREELGVSPAAAIERLRARLVASQQPASPDAVSRPVKSENPDRAGSPSLLTNLPVAMTSFIGRRHEQPAVRELLSSTRLLTLTGIGGSGKTRLAIQVAATMLDRFVDGVWLVELAALTDPASVLERVARAVGMPDLPPDQPLQDGLIRHLAPLRVLLVLDNCEHLLADCAELAGALLRACHQVRILATSRESLDIPGETTFRVLPLSMPRVGVPASPSQLHQYEAVQLFLERARAHRPGFTLTDRNAQAVGSICARLDGLPLAIELAAARIRSLSVENIDARLDQCFQLLTGGPRTALPRHQTLRAALDWSYDLLSPPEGALLRRLSVFAGGWTLEAAEAICAWDPVGNWEVLDVLSMLVDKSLVELDEREGGARYWLQETMRQYAHEKLMAANMAPDAHERHLAWYLNLAEEGSRALAGPEQLRWLDRLTAEHDNLRAALSWSTAVETQRSVGPAAALRLAGALWRFWWMRGFPHEGRRWLEMTLSDPDAGPMESRTRALDGAGVLAADQGDYGRARALHEESLALWRMAGDPAGVAGALNNLGSVAQQQGDHQAARVAHEESLTLYRALADAPGIAGALNQLACIARDDQGDYALAGTLLEESLALRRSLGDSRGVAISLNNLGLVAYCQSDYMRASTLLEESLALRQSLGDTRGIANSLGNLGRVAIGLRDYQPGVVLYQQSLALRRDQGDRRGIVECLEGLALVAVKRQETERAARLLGAAEALREEIGFPRLQPPRDVPDQAVAALCASLGEKVFAALWAAGRSLGLERAIALASEDASDRAREVAS